MGHRGVEPRTARLSGRLRCASIVRECSHQPRDTNILLGFRRI
jgi:hypothetical protein